MSPALGCAIVAAVAVLAISVAPAHAKKPPRGAPVAADDSKPPAHASGYFPAQRAQPASTPAQSASADDQVIMGRLAVGSTFSYRSPRTATRGGDDYAAAFSPSGDMQLYVGYEFLRILQLDLVGRVGFGGLNPSYFERIYGRRDLQSSRFYLGAQLRYHVAQLGPIRPYGVMSYGVDRLVTEQRVGTGSYTCSSSSSSTTCTEDTVRVFATGLWGNAFSFGFGLALDLGRRKNFSIVLETQRWYQWYNRSTHSAFRNADISENRVNLNEMSYTMGLFIYLP